MWKTWSPKVQRFLCSVNRRRVRRPLKKKRKLYLMGMIFEWRRFLFYERYLDLLSYIYLFSWKNSKFYCLITESKRENNIARFRNRKEGADGSGLNFVDSVAILCPLKQYHRTVNRHWWTRREDEGVWENHVEGTRQICPVTSEEGIL